MVSIIIVNYNSDQITSECLRSMQSIHTDTPFEIILVDNGSTDNSVVNLREHFQQIEIIPLDKNYGFGFANNKGAQKAIGEYLFFLNNDTVMVEDIITPMVGFLENHPDVGIIGPKLLNVDRSFQLSFGKFPSLFGEWITRLRQKHVAKYWKHLQRSNKTVQEIDWVSGAALMIRRSIFDQIDGFDTKYFMYFEDADLCARVKTVGFTTCWINGCSLVHQRGKSYTVKDIKIQGEYRKSQLYYYGIHRSITEKFLLKLYLIIKLVMSLLEVNKRADRLRILKIILHS